MREGTVTTEQVLLLPRLQAQFPGVEEPGGWSTVSSPTSEVGNVSEVLIGSISGALLNLQLRLAEELPW